MILGLVAALWLGGTSSVAFAQERPSAEREAGQLSERLRRLREETAATEARAERLGQELIDLAGDEARLRQNLSGVGERVATLETRIADDEAALAQLTADQARIRQELAGKRQELATILMALQRIGRRPPPALFSGGEGPTEVVRGAILLNAAIPGLDAQAEALAQTLNEAARLAADEEDRWARLKRDLADLAAEQGRLGALVDELQRRRAVSIYERDRASAELVRLAEEADSVEALMARLSSGEVVVEAPVGVAFTQRRGGLAQPVAGQVVSRFGEPTREGTLTKGRTIAALPQSTVFAPMPATVLYAAPFRSYGHVLILDAGGGYHMVLTGLEESFVDVGSRVEAGSALGRMGADADRSALTVAATGGRDDFSADRPLLYVELRREGAAMDSHGWWRDPAPGGGRNTE